MVSFQCDGCTDVVKKPKLDQHRSRCGASFTCIDCSRTFATPIDWKGHTSCISEEQKYQKSLYKPKTNGGARGHHSSAGGHFQGRGGSWNRQPPRSQATGANGAPLGAPLRMSPVTPSPPSRDEKPSAASSPPVVNNVDMKEKPVKAHKEPKPEVTDIEHANVVPSEAVVGGESDNTDEKKKEKKEKKEKKKEKKEKEKKNINEAVEPNTTTDGAEPTGLSLPSTSEAVAEERPKKSKKSKKDKKAEVVETEDAAVVDLEAPTVDMDIVDGNDEKKKKKKKRKSETANGNVEAEPSLPTDVVSEKKSKKRKRDGEEEAADTTEQAHFETDKKKKKKKKAAAS